MSEFKVIKSKVGILPHYNADFLELLKIGEFIKLGKKLKTTFLDTYIAEGIVISHIVLRHSSVLICI